MKYLLCHEQLDHIIRLLLTAVEDERETDRKTTDDLLVLGLPRVSQHLLRTGRVRCAEHDETQGVPSSLTSDSGVSEERLLEIVVRLCAYAAHTRNTETQRRAVLDDLVEQRTVLKGTQRRLLDAANTLGLSRDVIGWIERRRCVARVTVCVVAHV